MKFDSCLCVTSVIFCPLYETDRDQTGIDALNLELLNHLPGRNKKDAPFSAVYLHASYCNDCGWEKQR